MCFFPGSRSCDNSYRLVAKIVGGDSPVKGILKNTGTPKAYSGVQIRTVSALRIWRRQSLTGAEES